MSSNFFGGNIFHAVEILALLALAPIRDVNEEGYQNWVEKEVRYAKPINISQIVDHFDGMASEIETTLFEVEFVNGKIRVRSPDSDQLRLALQFLEIETDFERELNPLPAPSVFVYEPEAERHPELDFGNKVVAFARA